MDHSSILAQIDQVRQSWAAIQDIKEQRGRWVERPNDNGIYQGSIEGATSEYEARRAQHDTNVAVLLKTACDAFYDQGINRVPHSEFDNFRGSMEEILNSQPQSVIPVKIIRKLLVEDLIGFNSARVCKMDCGNFWQRYQYWINP
jgi:hypothetical protein